MKVLGSYTNGNYICTIFNDGTKVRENDLDNLTPEFAESCDIKITDFCNMNCQFCHEDSSLNGKHGDIMSLSFIDTIPPYTELAIGGGNPLSHPDFVPFLKKLYSRRVIANTTVNQQHFMQSFDKIKGLLESGLIRGLGVSVTSVTPEFITAVKQFPNIVLHVINGVIPVEDFKKLYDNNLKVLILGYKMFRRGNDFYSETVEQNKKELFDEMAELIKHFKIVSFDNLGLKQLEVKRLMSKERWDEFFMGDDGGYTFFIDTVRQEFSKSSTSVKRYAILPDIKEMFKVVTEEDK